MSGRDFGLLGEPAVLRTAAKYFFLRRFGFFILDFWGAVQVVFAVVGVEDIQDCAVGLVCGFDDEGIGAVEEGGLLFGDGLCRQVNRQFCWGEVIDGDSAGESGCGSSASGP